jgi:Fic family protein
MKPTITNILYMLKESNAIEREYDQQQLDDALEAWDYLVDNYHKEITPKGIKEAHAILMKNKRDIESKYKGDFRDVPVWIGRERKAQPKIVIESLIRDWCDKVNTSDRNYDPVTLHIEFEGIHPFIDGNGRMGRLLLNWHLVNRNGAPLLVYTEKDKQTYYRLFPSYRSRERINMYGELMKDWKPYHEQERNDSASGLKEGTR